MILYSFPSRKLRSSKAKSFNLIRFSRHLGQSQEDARQVLNILREGKQGLQGMAKKHIIRSVDSLLSDVGMGTVSVCRCSSKPQ
jgi:hypothetical protein